ncbi:MAG TPA: oligosaccharide flippase family protein [Bacteroidales bacterium]|nr:oligosaccharide flippase family protein [Bacteroidales bacterium]
MGYLFKGFDKKFFKNVSFLVIGTGAAQLVAFVFQLITRRIFSPADFGAFAVYFSLLGIIMPLSTLQYNRTIVLPKHDKDAVNITGLSFTITLLICIILEFVVLLFNERISDLLGLEEKYQYWLYFLPIGIMVYAIYEAINYYLIRKSAFKASAKSKVIRRSTEGVIQSTVGLFGKSIGLIFGDIIGNISNVLYVYRQAVKKGFSLKLLSRQEMQLNALKYIKFPKYSALSMFLNKMSLFFPVILINAFYSQEITGQIDLSRMILALPLSLITISLSQGLLKKISEAKNKKVTIKKEATQLFVLLGIISILGIVFILVLSNPLFKLFGNNWDQAAHFSNILVFGYAIKFIVSPFSSLFVALEKVKISSYWQYANFSIIFILIFFRDLSIDYFLWIYVILEVISYFFYLILCYKVILTYERQL